MGSALVEMQRYKKDQIVPHVIFDVSNEEGGIEHIFVVPKNRSCIENQIDFSFILFRKKRPRRQVIRGQHGLARHLLEVREGLEETLRGQRARVEADREPGAENRRLAKRSRSSKLFRNSRQ